MKASGKPISEKEPPLYWGTNKGEVILAIVKAGKTLTTEQIVKNTRLSLPQVKTATTELYQSGELTFDYDDFTFRVKLELYRDYRTFITFRKTKSQEAKKITEKEPPTSKLKGEKVGKTTKIPDEVILRLTYLRGVGIKTAKQLVHAGYETIEKIASANKYDLANELEKIVSEYVSVSRANSLILKAREVVKKIESGELSWEEVMMSVQKTRRQMDALKGKIPPEKKKTSLSGKIPDEVILRLTYLDGVGIKTADELIYAGYGTIEEIASANKYEIATVVRYYSVSRADSLILKAREVVKEVESGGLTWDEVIEIERRKWKKTPEKRQMEKETFKPQLRSEWEERAENLRREIRGGQRT